MMTRKTTETYEAPKVEIITVETEGMFATTGGNNAAEDNAPGWDRIDGDELE